MSKIIYLLIIFLGNYSFSQIKEDTLQIKEINDKDEIIKIQSGLIETALLQKNIEWLGLLLHEKLMLGHSNGWTETKESLLKSLPESRVVYKEFKNVEISKINFINDTIATLQKNLTVIGEYENTPFDLDLKILEVWIYEGHRWQLLARQSVEVDFDD